MNVQSAFQTGVQGFQNAQQSAQEAAQGIVQATTPADEQNQSSVTASNSSTPNLTQEIVNLKVSEHQAKASANVIKTADEVLGTLLDVKA